MAGTKSQFQLIDFARLDTLQILRSGGEPLLKTDFAHIRNGFKGILINGYGPTETTNHVFNETFMPKDEYTNSIGKPHANVRFYVLNELLRDVPPGAVGELYLAGTLSRGYLNRPEENAKSFILNPFLTDEEKRQYSDHRMYKTGDLVRWNYLGKLEYMGRNDSQVKF